MGSPGSERKAFYTISIVDKHGRQIGHEKLEKPATRSEAYKKLLKYLKMDKLANDSLVAGGYVHFDRFA